MISTVNEKYTPDSGNLISSNINPAPALAIDAHALGGMKAGNIKIYASQSGL